MHTTYVYNLSLHDALPIFCFLIFKKRINSCIMLSTRFMEVSLMEDDFNNEESLDLNDILDRKSTRLNSSHVAISYAVFSLKKKTICIITTKQVLSKYKLII